MIKECRQKAYNDRHNRFDGNTSNYSKEIMKMRIIFKEIIIKIISKEVLMQIIFKDVKSKVIFQEIIVKHLPL